MVTTRRAGWLLSSTTAWALLAWTPAIAQTRSTPGFAEPESGETAVARLLQSGDAREQAWGAWYAGRDHLQQFSPLLRNVVAQRVAGSSMQDRAAADVALDALIQMRQSLPSRDLAMVYQQRPEQALILAAYAATDDDGVEPFLLGVLGANQYDQWFAAANVLLGRRAPGLADAIIRSLRLTVQVFVIRADHLGQRVGFGSAAGIGIGCGAAGLAPGLPPWADYRLSTAGHQGLVVLATGPTPVYYQRILAQAGTRPSASVVERAAPSADLRLPYLAHLAGMTIESLPVRGLEFREVRLAAGAPVETTLASIRAEMLSRWSAIARALVQRGALAAQSAATALPAIELVVHDPQ